MNMVDFQADGLSDLEKASVLLAENCLNRAGETVAYRNNQRYLQIIKPLESSATSPVSILEDGKVYMIIGGAGGIGLKAAEQISRTVKAHLILIGSSEMDKEKQDQINRLIEYKSTVEYFRCDIANEPAVNDLIAQIKTKYGKINGIIHAGGINRDKLLTSKDWQTVQQVLSPKTKGTFIINELTKAEPLDFFVVFSSITAITGNIGQTDYATANGFLDAFIHYRQQNNFPGKSISINWTLWANTGMGKNTIAEDSFAKKTGVINAENGIKALFAIIDGSHEQVIVVGNNLAFEDFLTKNKQKFIKSEKLPAIQGRKPLIRSILINSKMY